jgi:hypothetical protein
LTFMIKSSISSSTFQFVATLFLSGASTANRVEGRSDQRITLSWAAVPQLALDFPSRDNRLATR